MSDAYLTAQDVSQDYALACRLYPLSDLMLVTAGNPTSTD